MDAQGHYQQLSIETATPAQLVSLLYHGAIAAVVRARHAIEGSRHEAAHADLVKAQAILTELQVTLDHERGGAISESLEALYVWCNELLVRANVAKDVAPLDEVAGLLGELVASWDEMVAGQAALVVAAG